MRQARLACGFCDEARVEDKGKKIFGDAPNLGREPTGRGQAPPLLYTGVAGRSSGEEGWAWQSPWPP